MIKKKSDPDSSEVLLSVLRGGGIAIIPCDTIYGIVGRCSDTEGKIRQCKGRDRKPFIRLLPDTEGVYRYTDQLPPREILSLWPAPLTLVVADFRKATVALRVPDDPFLLGIIKNLKDDLFSTSVNMSGKEIVWRIEEIYNTFKDKVDLILDDGDLPGRKPSTILDISEKPFRIIRQGACVIPPELLL